MARLTPGSQLAGNVIEEQVGAGGMAVVFRARDAVVGRLAALKVLSPALAADQEFRTRFLSESRAVASVEEPHIIPVYGAGEVDGVLYIATRFVRGLPLDGRADQYALAVMAFTLLAGDLPFHRPETMATLFAHLNDPVPPRAAARRGPGRQAAPGEQVSRDRGAGGGCRPGADPADSRQPVAQPRSPRPASPKRRLGQ